jgi:7-cyano-7-deazaguanine synthase
LDSITLAYKVAASATLGRLMSFDYGQRHRKEIAYARRCAAHLKVPHDLVDISSVGCLLAGSALTGGTEVPHGHYAEETMRVTVVPNRNAIMLTVAFGAAAAQRIDMVAAAIHGGDHFIYPDCRPRFVDAFQRMQMKALEGLATVSLYTPFLHMSKADIVREGAILGVPFSETWSCYEGGARHCGRCGTCVERREAFHLAAVDDPTSYEDPQYWIKACQKQ